MSGKFTQTIKLIIFDWEGTLGDSHGELLPGVSDTLHYLKAQHFDLALATSMPTTRLEQLLAQFGLTQLFVHYQTSEMGYPKPDPQMIEEILLSTHHTAEETVMVGDSMFDMLMAEEVHVGAIGVLTGSDNEEKLQLGAEKVVVIESVNVLPECLHIREKKHARG